MTSRSTLTLLGSTALLALPIAALAGAPTGLVPCGTTVSGGMTTNMCDFDGLVTLAQNVINFLIFKFSAPLAAIMFVYAGILYLTAAGNEGKVSRAHNIFWDVLLGFCVILAAWLIINFILNFFVGSSAPLNLLG
ncbi:MAG TPA: pilin [Candidatus Paceibacterota bacterium]|nr:pilin [Candidatus Paceibacterota bacterium]